MVWVPHRTHILDLLHTEVRIRGNTDRMRPYVHDDHDRSRYKAFKKLVDLQVRCTQLWARMVPANYPLLRYILASTLTSRYSRTVPHTVHFAEHRVHSVNIVVVQEPGFGVALVFLKWDTERVRDVDRFAEILAKQHSNNAFRRATCEGPSMMVCYG